jgi:hypothetical protein
MCEHENKQIVTISDRVRAMSDEEWVKYFGDMFDDDQFCTNCGNEKMDCDLCRLAWLRKPAEELHV